MSENTDAAQKGNSVEGVTKGATHGALKKTSRICTVEEGQACLEEAQLIEPKDMLGLDTLASTLVQISFLPGMPQAIRDPMHAIVLLLAQTTLVNTGEAVIEGVMDCIVDKLSDVVKAATLKPVSVDTTSTLKALWTVWWTGSRTWSRWPCKLLSQKSSRPQLPW